MCAGCAGAWLGKSRQHLCIYSWGAMWLGFQDPSGLLEMEGKMLWLGFGHEVASKHCAPKNPFWLVSLSSLFCDWWEVNSPFFAVCSCWDPSCVSA